MKKQKRNFNYSKFIIIMVIAAFAYVSQACGSGSKKNQLKKLNVILITIDTLRADYVGIYGKGKADTPNLDALAGEGVWFEKCIAHAPLTLPSHTSILSGTYPLHHQVRDNGGFLVPKQLDLVSEVLKKEKNMTTSAFIASYVLHSKWGLDQGFDTYSNVIEQPDSTEAAKVSRLERRAENVFKDAQQWIKENKEKQFFSWIHLYDPHTPYAAPSPYKEKFADNPYRGEVEYTDEQVGKFIDFLKEQKLYENSLIIVTADHGEGLYDHGEPTHCFFIYNTTAWVPLIIRAPIQFPVKRIKQTVEHVDLASTIFDALGIPEAKELQGETLLPLMMDERGRKKELAYTETYYTRLHYGWSEVKGFYKGKYKYIEAPKPELYNQETDFDETDNLFFKESFKSKKLKSDLAKFIRDKSKNALLPGSMKTASQKDLRKLESLGYVTTSVDTRGKKNLADPKDKLEIYNAYLNTHELTKQKKYDEAIEVLKKIIAESPEIIDAHLNLSIVYRKKKMLKKALEVAYNVLEQKTDYYAAMVNIVMSHMELENYSTAIKNIRKFQKIFPDDHILYVKLGMCYYYQEDLDTALTHLKKAVELEPKSPFQLNKIGEIFILKEQYEKAENYIKQALAFIPDLKTANYQLGQIQEAGNNIIQANQYYRQELRVNPKSYKASYNLAGNLKKAGKIEEAVDLYKKVVEFGPNFKMGYFMLANVYLEKGDVNKYPEAITLCKKGIDLKLEDKETLFGYFIITNLFAKLGDQRNLGIYNAKGESLNQKLQKQ